MIEAVQTLEGKVVTTNQIDGELNKAIEYVEPTTQIKTITPTKQEQIVEPDENVFALSKVIVEPIGEEYIIPTGTEEISSNGLHNVKNKEYANVSITPNLQNKSLTITSNTTTTIQADENYDGLGNVSVTTSVGQDLTKYGYPNGLPLIEWQIPIMDSIQQNWNPTTTNASHKFNYKYNIVIFPYIDTSNVTNIQYMFEYCTGLKDFPLLDFSKVTGNGHYGCFNNCGTLSPGSINNILLMCSRMTLVTSSKKLSSMGLSFTSSTPVTREQVEALPNYQTFIDAGWTLS